MCADHNLIPKQQYLHSILAEDIGENKKAPINGRSDGQDLERTVIKKLKSA